MKKIFITLVVMVYSVLSIGQTEVSGSLNANTTWTLANSPYLVTADVIVEPGVTLTIQPGVVVKHNGWGVNIIVRGVLNASGTSNNQIVFTSFHDDQHGGDSNQNGGATGPAAGNWAGLLVEDVGNATFDQCWFGYGGGAGFSNLDVYSNNVNISNCSFNHSSDKGIYVRNAGLHIYDSYFFRCQNHGIYFDDLNNVKDIILEDNIFRDNQWAVFAYIKDNSSSIFLENNISTGAWDNGYARNGFGIRGPLTGDRIFQGQLDFPFIVISNDLTIGEGASLTLTPGTGFKLDDWNSSINVKGYLSSVGTESETIYYTSINDDTKGGDTNGNGDDTVPLAGNWGGVIIESTGSADIAHSWFDYGAGSTWGNVDIYSNDVEISNCRFTNSSDKGIYANNAALHIYNSYFFRCQNHGIYFDDLNNAKDIILEDNIFQDNQWAVFTYIKDNSSSIYLNNNTSTGAWDNGYARNGFGIRGPLTGDRFFQGQNDFPFIVVGSDLIIEEDASLTVTPGTGFKSDDWNSSINVKGHLLSIGTDNEPIYYTSINDDTKGGDTNGNEDITIPAAANWGGVIIESTGSAGIAHSWFDYGAGSTLGNMDIYSNDVEISDCRFTNSADKGIYANNTALHIYDSYFFRCQNHGIYFDDLNNAKDIILQDNIFEDNQWAVFAYIKDNSSSIYLNNNTSSGAWDNGYARNGFSILGPLTGDRTFQGQNDFPFIVVASDLTIEEGASLFVTPGTGFKSDDWNSSINVKGYLSSIGTENEPIYYTSINDDTKGGDTNGNEDITIPLAANWGGVIIESTGSADIAHSWFDYGAGSTLGNMDIYSNDVEISDCRFTNSSDRGIYANNAALHIYNSYFSRCTSHGIFFDDLNTQKDIILEDNVFQDNQWAVFAYIKDNSSSIYLNNNTSSGVWDNGYARNGFGIRGPLTGNRTFQGQINFPFIIISNDLTIVENASLTVTPSTVFKFDDWNSSINVNGTFKSKGTPTEHIWYTSINDDCISGDTNGNLDGTVPEKGNYGGVILAGNSIGNEIEYSEFFFGGGSTNGNLTIQNDNTTVENSIFAKGSDRGIHIDNGSPMIRNSVFYDNSVGIGLHGTSNPDITNCDIFNNASWGMWSQQVTDIGDNYWGASSGPYNLNSNPEGFGNPINDNVSISGWLEGLSDQSVVPVPDFNYIYSGSNYSFYHEDKFDSYTWLFGDTVESHVKYPFYRYEIPGLYEVCLTGVKDCHIEMTQCKAVEVKGINSVTPTKGGNTGDVTIKVYGVGFTSDSYFKLVKNGVEIMGSDYVLNNDGVLLSTFDLYGASLGMYDLVLIIPGLTTFVKPDIFEVEQGTIADPWVTITGRPNALSGTKTKFKVNYGNDGNTDAKSVPITIIVSDLPDLEIDFPEIVIDWPPFTDPYDPGFPPITLDDCYTIVSSVQGIEEEFRVYTLNIPIISALTVETIDISISSRESYNLFAWTGTSFYPGGFNDHYIECFVEVFQEFGYSQTIIDLITVDRLITYMEYITRYYYDEVGATICWDQFWAWAISEVVEFQLTEIEIIDIVQRFTEIYVDAYAFEHIYIECIEIIIPHDYEDHPVDVVTSFDPNEKTGVTGVGTDNYINEMDYLTYIVFFENVDSATAPAHTIIIKDTLDPDVFDLSFFSFDEMVLGNDVIEGVPRAPGHVIQYEIPHLNVMARIESEMNMNTGALVWTFRSFDPLTGEEVEDPFVGILPPNITSPEGEGHVTFTIGLKKPVKHGDVIGNQAEIYFDANDPIITNVYINTFDLKAPDTRIDDLPPEISDTIRLEIIGDDDGSGIEFYEIWVAQGFDDFRLDGITKESTYDFIAPAKDEYQFYSVAVDKVGNKENYPDVADATTLFTSVEDLEYRPYTLNIYPNPVSDLLNVNLVLDDKIKTNLKIVDLLGRELQQITNGWINAQYIETKIDVSMFDAGIYYIQVQVEGQKYLHRVVMI